MIDSCGQCRFTPRDLLSLNKNLLLFHLNNVEHRVPRSLAFSKLVVCCPVQFSCWSPSSCDTFVEVDYQNSSKSCCDIFLLFKVGLLLRSSPCSFHFSGSHVVAVATISSYRCLSWSSVRWKALSSSTGPN